LERVQENLTGRHWMAVDAAAVWLSMAFSSGSGSLIHPSNSKPNTSFTKFIRVKPSTSPLRNSVATLYTVL
jgi:hypothetical protein